MEVTPEWQNLDDPKKATDFGGKWILAGKFVIKKRSKDLVAIKELDLAWRGKKIDRLNASLFKKEQGHDFLPLEENLICDGQWNRTKQILQMKFCRKEYLQPTTIYCLVLTVPQELEKALRTGHFELVPDKLPRQLQPAAQKKSLKISMLAYTPTKPRPHRFSRYA